LSAGERVVTSGQFMLDSESQLREAIQKMTGRTEAAERVERESVESETSSVEDAPTISRSTRSTIYICPMPEHVAIEHTQPGKCNLCGMGLVPVSPEMLARIQPGGTIEGYTCPMPEHSDVRQDKPGKCPKCGMTLVPIMSLPELPEEPATLYTCPMASHAHVVSDKPGKCPECDMELVPTNGVRHGRTAEENWRKQQHEH
jgi:rubrerythrin